jgi:alpha-glucosidase
MAVFIPSASKPMDNKTSIIQDRSTMNYLWWQTGVIYQIYPRSYNDTTGNGIGDIPGIIEKLDYLSETLGIDAIWLSPFYPSPMADFGYDVADYCNVHPMFGTLADFDRLVVQAHQRDLKIIIDWVPNHTSDQHPWFLESRSSRENPKRDWYIWRDPTPLNAPVNGGKLEGGPPNNWLAVFGGSAWEWDQATGQYYLHSFLKEQPDLNWRNAEVRAAMFDTIRFWLARGADGFRVDVAHFIMKDPQLHNNPPAPKGKQTFHRPHGSYDSQLHLYDKGHPDVHAVYRQFRALLDEYSAESPRMAVGEIHIFDWPEWASYYGSPSPGLEFHLPFNFSLLKARWEAQEFRQLVDQLEAILPEWAWPNYVLGNHDEGRIATRYGADQARVAAMLLLTLRGTPTIYYGEELGMIDVDIPLEDQLDPFGLRVPGWGRDRCRTPMQWDAGRHAGFSPPETPRLWLPLSGQYPILNIAEELDDPRSSLSLYRQLLTLRKSSPALQQGSYTPVDRVPSDCFVYLREFEYQKYLIALNFSGQYQSITFPGYGSAKFVLSTYLDRAGQADLQNFTLRPNEGIIFTI